LISSLFDKKTAFFAALLFIVHPINTEIIDWVSAQFYVVLTIFLYLCLLLQVQYRKTGNKKYLYGECLIFAASILLIQHPWTLIIPLGILVLDFFFLRKKNEKLPFYTPFALMVLPMITLFLVFRLGNSIKVRVQDRAVSSGRVLTNQQRLTPVLEGYPYSISEMVKLYTAPTDLTIYYDGKPISELSYWAMYIIAFLYLSAIIYFYRHDRRVCGVLVMMLVLVAPVFSPLKVTWYMTERYLYFGTGFFTTLLVLLFFFIEKKLAIKHIALFLTLLALILYGIRTYTRNAEWKNPKTLALATIHTSPESVRPYNDLAGYYAMNGRYEEAIPYYEQAIARGGSLTAMRNLGYIYMKQGIDNTSYSSENPSLLYSKAKLAQQSQDTFLAMYYFKEVASKDPHFGEVMEEIVSLYIEGGLYQQAHERLVQLQNDEPNNANVYYLLGYLSFKEGNTNDALTYLEKVLLIDPTHLKAKTNREMLMASP
jgi:tetratricopeptide (TPR) repeat protein